MAGRWTAVRKPASLMCPMTGWGIGECAGTVDWCVMLTVTEQEADGPYCEAHARRMADEENRKGAD